MRPGPRLSWCTTQLFIEDLKWASSEAFAELLALCQCLPGPSSTQMSFAIGTTKRGVLGGLLSGILFQYPGLVLMTVLGAFADDWAGTDVIDKHASLGGFVSGISAAGVALVASAAWGLGNKLCKDHDTKLISVISAVVALYYGATPPRTPTNHPARAPAAVLGDAPLCARIALTELAFWPPAVTGWIFPLLLLLGGIVTYFYRGPLPPADGEVSAKKAAAASGVQDFGVGRPVGAMLVAAWLAILGVGIALVASTDYDDWKELHWFEVRVGACARAREGGCVLPGAYAHLGTQRTDSSLTRRPVPHARFRHFIALAPSSGAAGRWCCRSCSTRLSSTPRAAQTTLARRERAAWHTSRRGSARRPSQAAARAARSRPRAARTCARTRG